MFKGYSLHLWKESSCSHPGARNKITKKKINMYYTAKINTEIYIDASRRAITFSGIYLL